MAQQVTAPTVKAGKGGTPLVMVTAYDAPTARIADDAGVDIILVGDSVAMAVLGYDDTLQVTVADMAHHVAAVSRAGPRAMVVADLPWLSYHVSTEDTVRNAATVIRAGAQAVKLEGGVRSTRAIEAIVRAGIPVMGHAGLTPQTATALGGYRAQGRTAERALDVACDALALQDAGCFSLVLEAIPAAVSEALMPRLEIPVIGIGAGGATDGQVLVFHDLLGIYDGLSPRFAKRYANLEARMIAGVREYADEVRAGLFPAAEHTYSIDPEELERFGQLLEAQRSGSPEPLD